MDNGRTPTFSGSIPIRNSDQTTLMNLSRDMGLGLDIDEMIRLRNYFSSMGREPTETELQAMGQAWSEHCCYKSSKIYLKKYLSNLKTPYTVLAMEDDAGVVNVTGDLDYVVKMESHNHPSAVEPYGGAATGVGGILRDILCMGSQPIAVIDSLYLGNGRGEVPEGYLNTHFTNSHIVAGIRDYGNRVGIPTVAGSLHFDQNFEGIPLVNVGCVGVIRSKDISRSRVSSTSDILILAGGKTGRDGIHGVNFASRDLEKDDKESKKAVQLGNPIIKEPLIKAILEANSRGLIAGMKDLGGGGLSSAAGELCLAGGSGGEIYLDRILLKEEGMKPWEIWISESQERMLLAVKEENVETISGIFEMWGIPFSIIGKAVPGKRMKLFYRKDLVMDLSLNFLTSGPIYSKPYYQRDSRRNFMVYLMDPKNLEEEIMDVIRDLNNSGKFPIIRQYDHTVRGNTVVKPFAGNPNMETHTDSPVIRLDNDSTYGVALSSGCSVNAMEINPYTGTLWTMARAFRNVLCSGADPHSVVDALNFGNPNHMGVMRQFVRSLEAIGEFCRYFSLPVVAGNVSLYNHIGKNNIPPTPNILIIGVIDNYNNSITPDFKEVGSTIYLLGSSGYSLAGSQYARSRGKEAGSLENLDLEELSRFRKLILKYRDSNMINSIHDISTGGLLVALLEMSFGSQLGFVVDISFISHVRVLNKLFSESGNRFIMEVKNGREEDFEEAFKGVLIKKIGQVGGEDAVIVNDSQTIMNRNIRSLREIWERGMENII
ncbi:MAG: phosphoribosylformylglycinamidine synthase subunit PurL [Cuniculiplasma sp.]